MTPIIAVFMSMISLLALVADRANLQEQGEAIPLPSVDDGVSRNFLDVAKRTLPLRMTPTRSMNLRRIPRDAPGPTLTLDSGAPVAVALAVVGVPPGLTGAPDGAGEAGDHTDNTVLLKSLIIHALRKRDIRGQLMAEALKTSKSSADHPSPRAAKQTRSSRPTTLQRPQRQRPNSLGELEEDLMAHGRDREQLRRRWKIQNSKHRMANVHG